MSEPSEQSKQLLKQLQALSNPKNVEGMARFGINPQKALGIAIPDLRRIAKTNGKNHLLAQELWATAIHEARILATMMDTPAEVTEEQMERWVVDFDSWDVCDQCCGNLFDRTPFAYRKALEWSRRKEEFVRRAGFVLMASLAVHDKGANDKQFEKFLPAIRRASNDERNFVKKAVNWALRQIGKRNLYLNEQARATARELQNQDSRAAQWVAAGALRELESAAVQKKLRSKKGS